MKVSYHCSECNKSWTQVLASLESRNCKFCNRTVYGEKVITKPPPPPPTANKSAPAAAPPRRWETVPRPSVEQSKEETSTNTSQPERETNGTLEAATDQADFSSIRDVEVKSPSEAIRHAEKSTADSEYDKTTPTSATEKPNLALASDVPPKRRKPRIRLAEHKETPIPHPSTVREYIPVDQRPENQRPKPKFYRFFALNSPHAPGIAGAIAESHDEAVERIVLRFLQNVVLLSNRNRKIAEIRLKYRPLMREQSPQEFNRVLREAGITPQQYDRMLGPTPPDSLGAWNPHLQHNITEEAANNLKEELMQAPYVEYPIEDCAFYQGPAF